MAKGAAKEEVLGGLHSLLARVFQRTLEKYLHQLEAVDEMRPETPENDDELKEQFLADVLVEIQEPSPAMLSAVSKFLKDNDIGMDTKEVENLNSTQRRLEEKRKLRKAAGVSLSVVPHVEQG